MRTAHETCSPHRSTAQQTVGKGKRPCCESAALRHASASPFSPHGQYPAPRAPPAPSNMAGPAPLPALPQNSPARLGLGIGARSFLFRHKDSPHALPPVTASVGQGQPVGGAGRRENKVLVAQACGWGRAGGLWRTDLICGSGGGQGGETSGAAAVCIGSARVASPGWEACCACMPGASCMCFHRKRH